jgi:hypothetical protein
LSLAQRAYLDFREGEAWEKHVAQLQTDQAAKIRAAIEPLRDALLGFPAGNSQSEDWRRIVRELVDSAKPPEEES